MDRRERLKQILTTFLTILVTVLAARFGIPIPPPVVPEGSIPPPIINLPAPEKPGAAPTEPARPDAAAALARLALPGVGCSCTIIGPRREDGRWNVLTAAHCVKAVGQYGELTLKDGRKIGASVVNIDRKADAAWMVTTAAHASLPFALLAERSPAVGSRIWHAGYGIDKPGNREEGTVTGGANGDGQLQFRLSVSSGDSGGGIVLNESGEIVSCVCCTTGRGQVADVWGCSPEAARRAFVAEVAGIQWDPIDVPLRMPEKK